MLGVLTVSVEWGYKLTNEEGTALEEWATFSGFNATLRSQAI